MPKPKEKRINIDRSKVTRTKPKTRDLVECTCVLHCNGSKMIDPRTRRRHQREMALFQAIASETQSSSRSRSTNLQPIDAASSSTSVEQNQNSSDESSNNESSDNYEVQTSQGPIDVSLKK